MGLFTQDPNLGGESGTPPVADTTLKRLALTPDALAGASALSALSITQTLNTSGSPVIFDVDVTDTASGAGTLLARFRVGGASALELTKSGALKVPSLAIGSGLGSTFGQRYGNGINISDIAAFDWGTSGHIAFWLHSEAKILWDASGEPSSNTPKSALFSPSAGQYQFGVNHATTPTTQTIKAHDVVTGTGANLVLAGGTGSVANGDVILDGENRAAFVADANALISFTGGDTVSLMTLESDFGALVSAFNALKATVISHGLMNPA